MSSDERLDQSFNSIDAQREAGQAYIASQRAEGSGELTGINVRWRKLGWAELVREFKPRTIDSELLEVEA